MAKVKLGLPFVTSMVGDPALGASGEVHMLLCFYEPLEKDFHSYLFNSEDFDRLIMQLQAAKLYCEKVKVGGMN